MSKQPKEHVSRNWTKRASLRAHVVQGQPGRMEMLLWMQTALAPSMARQFPTSRGKKTLICYQKYDDCMKKMNWASPHREGTEMCCATCLHSKSCNMEEVIIAVAISKWELFGTAGDERISCSLAAKQGAMSALIRSVCSAGAQHQDNCCLSYNALPIQHLHLIYPWGGGGGTICIQRLIMDVIKH